MADLEQALAWHRQIAALVTAADRVGVAEEALPQLRARLFAQQARLAEIAAAHGAPLPALAPTAMEVSAAATALGDLSPEAVDRCVRSATATLDATDVLLNIAPSPSRAGAPAPVRSPLVDGSAPDGPDLQGSATFPGGQPPTGGPLPGSAAFPGGQPPLSGPLPGSATFPGGHPPVAELPPVAASEPGRRRWPVAVTYLAYALVCLVVQFGFLVAFDQEPQLAYASPVCLLVLPAFAWAAAFVTLAATHRGADRRPRLGAVICFLPDVFWLLVFVPSLLSKLV